MLTHWILKLRNRHFLIFDLLLLALLPTASLALRLDDDFFTTAELYRNGVIVYTGLSLVLKAIVFYKAGLYGRYWRYASVDELAQIFVAVVAASIVLNGIFYGLLAPLTFPQLLLPLSIGAIDALLSLLGVAGSRFAVRLAERHRHDALGVADERRVLIVGAGDTGQMIVREMQNNPRLGLVPLGLIDDDPHKQGVRIHNVPVVGNLQKLTKVAHTLKIEQVVIAMPSAAGKTIRAIVRVCEQANLQVRTVPSLTEILNNRVSVSQIRDVQIEDLLRREPIQIDTTAVRAMIAGRKVLVTGAGGSIGSELCRQIARYEPSEIVLLGHGEHSIFTLASEFARTQPSLHVVRAIADVRDAARIHKVFGVLAPDLIFHAAAHKHVPLMEENLEDAVTNNVLGTRNVVEAAVANGIHNLVLVSTDKAVNPTSAMGVTKRIAELIVTQAAHQHGGRFVSVRFGNVLGSRGSVLNIFREQIALGGPVTVTHPEMRRYFMTIPEAVMLVLQAMTLGKGGETFVLDMGEPIKIADMAHDLIELSGLQVGRDVDIEFTGVRPGEKLFEELFLQDDHYERTQHQKIFVSRNGVAAFTPSGNGSRPLTLDERVDGLIAAARASDGEQVRRCLMNLVPEYQNQHDSVVLPLEPSISA